MNILLGISGGIAAYKTPELVRRLRDRGADVQIVMTASAHEFVTETALSAVAGRPVRDNLWDKAAEASMSHIELARWADAVLIAPATAEVMARLASGAAGDLLTTLVLAWRVVGNLWGRGSSWIRLSCGPLRDPWFVRPRVDPGALPERVLRWRRRPRVGDERAE